MLSRGRVEGHGGLRGEGLILLLGRPPWGQAGGVLPPGASSSPSRSTPPRPQPATWVLIPRSLCPPGTQSELGCPFPIWRRKKQEWLGFPLALDTNLHFGSAWRVHDSPPLPTMMALSESPFLHPLLPRPTAALTSTTRGIPPVLTPIQKKALGSVYLGCSQPLRSPFHSELKPPAVT